LYHKETVISRSSNESVALLTQTIYTNMYLSPITTGDTVLHSN
jgi:hypothetical protein